MTGLAACGMIGAPRRWDRGSPAGPRPSAGAGGRSPIPRPAWRTDHPSAGAEVPTPDFAARRWPGGVGPGTSLDARSRTRGYGCGEVVLRYPAGQGGQGRPSVTRPSEAAEQGVLRAQRRIRSWPSGASPDALLLLSHPRAARRHGAGGAGEDSRAWQSVRVASSSLLSPAVVRPLRVPQRLVSVSE